jgi:predicted Zn-dependent protease
VTRSISRRIMAAAAALALVLQAISPSMAQTARRNSGPSLIRDAEIEGLMRLYTKPIFRAAGINPGAVRVYLIADPSINAFVAGGQRLFINTGLLMQAKSPNEVIGVLAHESGHIAGGHLARMGIELDRASATAIIGSLLGVAAMVGGAAAGNADAARAGTGVIAGSQGLAQRTILSYQRAMESSADQAALKYLTATHQSARGMLLLFQKLASESIASAQTVDPYVLSHPMPFDRIQNLEVAAKKSPYYDAPDNKDMLLRHKLMQAKLTGFLEPAQVVFQKYPMSDTSLSARYARSIAMFRRGDTKNSVAVIDSLIKELPQDPFFWELKGQALLEGGNPAAAVEPLRKAVDLIPTNGLIRILYAQALVATESTDNAKLALTTLRLAQKTEPDTPSLFSFMASAYGRLGDVARADLATAEAAMLSGDKKLAIQKAQSAQSAFKRGTPEWQRSDDILNFASRK